MKKNKLYLLLLLACLVGYTYTAISYRAITQPNSKELVVCFIKHTTSIPCPSCGSTRSMISLLQADISSALYWNPIGLVLFTILIIAPFWILYDVLKRKSSLFIFYTRMEVFLRRKWVFIPALLLVTGNWIWNIYKDL